MKRKGIILGLFTLTVIGMSCNNSKTAVVGAGENKTNTTSTDEKKGPIIETQEIQRTPSNKVIESIRQAK